MYCRAFRSPGVAGARPSNSSAESFAICARKYSAVIWPAAACASAETGDCGSGAGAGSRFLHAPSARKPMKIGTTSTPEKARRESVYMGTPGRSGDDRRETVGRASARRNLREEAVKQVAGNDRAIAYVDKSAVDGSTELSACDPGPRRTACIAGNWHWITSRRERRCR